MAKIDDNEVRNWSEFKTSINRELFGDRVFRRDVHIFRGQRSADWNLISSFDRWAESFPSRDRTQLASELLQEFKIECEGMDLPSDVYSNDTKMLALAQHHGLPTRLIDWSLSPYIAAFFAFSDAVIMDDLRGAVAVWSLDVTCGIWSAEMGVEVVAIPTIGNIRLRNQSGRFTLSRTPFPTLEEYVRYVPRDVVALRRFLIPVDDAEEAIADLDAMGIRHSSLFPDVAGCSRAAQMRVALRNSDRE